MGSGQWVCVDQSADRLAANQLLLILGLLNRGLSWVTLHTFRHTCASLLFAPKEHGGGGKSLKQVQEWLGHHSPAFACSFVRRRVRQAAWPHPTALRAARSGDLSSPAFVGT